MPSDTQFLAMFDASQVRPYMPAIPVLLSASSFESLGRARGTAGRLPVPNIPPQVTEIAVDPGGFVAQHIYGGYRFTWDAYVAWLHALGPRLSWAAFPDLPCERELASDAYAVRARQEQTLAWCYELWSDGFSDCSEGFLNRVAQPWSWVATVQGRNVDEYVWMANELAVFVGSQAMETQWAAEAPIEELEDGLLEVDGDVVVVPSSRAVARARSWGNIASQFRRVAIGSLCQRTDVSEVVSIVQAVHEVLPDERFHLWGVKLGAIAALREAGLMPYIVSLDSSAWNGRFRGRIDAIDAAAADLKYSQRQYSILEALPSYLARVAAELAVPQPVRMF